eukprot:2111912-Ditylum_brightwellii.AAC.1
MDFKLYNSVDYAQTGSNKWLICNHNDMVVHFPCDSRPSGRVNKQWSCESVVIMCREPAVK